MNLKTLLAGVSSLVLLNSCVFESPFETEARIPVDPLLLGRWEVVPPNDKQAPERMLVLQHSANEYLVEYRVGEKALFFRTFAVGLAGGEYFQVQWIGSADGPVKAADRKYHLFKVSVDGDALEMCSIDPDILGDGLGDPDRMKAAFRDHKDDPKLFGEPETFRRIK